MMISSTTGSKRECLDREGQQPLKQLQKQKNQQQQEVGQLNPSCSATAKTMTTTTTTTTISTTGSVQTPLLFNNPVEQLIDKLCRTYPDRYDLTFLSQVVSVVTDKQRIVNIRVPVGQLNGIDKDETRTAVLMEYYIKCPVREQQKQEKDLENNKQRQQEQKVPLFQRLYDSNNINVDNDNLNDNDNDNDNVNRHTIPTWDDLSAVLSGKRVSVESLKELQHRLLLYINNTGNGNQNGFGTNKLHTKSNLVPNKDTKKLCSLLINDDNTDTDTDSNSEANISNMDNNISSLEAENRVSTPNPTTVDSTQSSLSSVSSGQKRSFPITPNTSNKKNSLLYPTTTTTTIVAPSSSNNKLLHPVTTTTKTVVRQQSNKKNSLLHPPTSPPPTTIVKQLVATKVSTVTTTQSTIGTEYSNKEEEEYNPGFSMSARPKVTEYVGTRVNSIVGSVSDSAVAAAIDSLTQVIEYQRRELAMFGKELREARTQIQNLGTFVNHGYIHMSNQFNRMYSRTTICQQCNVAMFSSTNAPGIRMTGVHNPNNVDIPRPELETQVPAPTFVHNQPTIPMTTTVAAAPATAKTEVTPTEVARAAGIDAVHHPHASNQAHRPNMAIQFPSSWQAVVAEWRRENLSDFDRKGVPIKWNDSKLQQRFAKRLRCIRLIRRIATRQQVEESKVVEELDRNLNAIDKLTLSKQLADLERDDPYIKRRTKK